MAVDAAGNVYVTGVNTGSGTGKDYVTIKYNSAGVQQWAQRYNGTSNSNDGANSITVDAAGNVYVTGVSSGSGTGADYVTIKYNSSGVQQWTQRYNGTGNGFDEATSMAVDGAGNVYVTGISDGSGTGEDYATIKYNSSGVQQWVQRYNGYSIGSDAATSLSVDISGNVYVTGESSGYVTGTDYVTIKYNSAGVQQWSKRYNGTGNGSDGANSMVIDASGNVYVAGGSTGIGTSKDYEIIKYSQVVGIQPNGTEIPSSFSLSQNYPNPFNPITNIGIRIADFGFVTLKVYDISGKEVAVLVNENLNPGIYNVDFDAGNLGSGAYFYKIEAGKFTETRKMMLIK